MAFKKYLYLVVCCIVVFAACKNEVNKTNLSVAEYENAIAEGNIQLLDVRTPGEYQSGHLYNAFLADWTNMNEFGGRVMALDKSKPVYTYCLSGARSDIATQWLRKNGFLAFNMTGGINAWKKAGKPMEQAEIVKQITLPEYLAMIPADKTVLVDISAVWCPPCRIMKPVIDSLARIYGTKFELVKIDGGRQMDICSELKVEGFPTFIIYKQGKEIWRKEGLADAKEFVQHF